MTHFISHSQMTVRKITMEGDFGKLFPMTNDEKYRDIQNKFINKFI